MNDIDQKLRESHLALIATAKEMYAEWERLDNRPPTRRDNLRMFEISDWFKEYAMLIAGAFIEVGSE